MASEKKQITRTRISYSCATCRRRKVKCDKVHPKCGGCQRAGEECIWTDGDKPTLAKSTEVNEGEQQHDGDASRKRRAVDICAGDDGDSEGASSVAMATIGAKIERLNGLIQDLSRLTPASSTGSPDGSHHLIGKSTVPTGPEASVADSASIADVLMKLDQLNRLLTSGVKPRIRPFEAEPDRTNQDVIQQPLSNQSHVIKSTERPHKLIDRASVAFGPGRNVLAPMGEEGNALFRSWLFSTYPILPIFPPKEVFRKWQVFNNWYRLGMDKGEPNPDPSFMPFLRLVWYCGYTNLSDRGKDKWFPWAASEADWISALRRQVDIALEVRSIETMPSIWSLGASVIYQHLGMDGQDMISCSIRNMVNVRMAQSLGLHTEKTMKGLVDADAEIRRRLWWEILSADAALSTVSGMPVIMDETYTNTNMISELKETVLGTSEAEEYKKHIEEGGADEDRPDDPATAQTSSVVSVFHLVAQARHKLTVVTKQILKTNMRAQPMTMPELKEVRKALHQASSKVHDIINRIPTKGVPEHDFTPVTAPQADLDGIDSMGAEISESEIDWFTRTGSTPKGFHDILIQHRRALIAFHKWARITLSLLLDRIECVSYAPFLRNSKSRLWATSRSCALKGCHGFMRKYLSLREDWELRRFHPVWYSSCHPMHATVIMLIDVHDRPHTEEASRSRAMIDKVLSFSAPEKRGLSALDLEKLPVPLREGGREAWTMLRKLRHKAWQKAGLDPDVLWTEEDQMAVGVGKPLNENDLFVRELREDILCHHSQMQHRKTIERSSKLLNVRPPERILMHPSELGPGDQVSGSITKAIEDMGSYTDMPRILLLRAHHDQELMPYPIQCCDTKTHSQYSERVPPPADVGGNTATTDSNSNGLHIGELIKRIRQSKVSKKSTNSTVVSDNELPLDRTSPEDVRCDFRAVRDTARAAYQDILESHSESPVPGLALTLGSSDPMRTNHAATDIVNGASFRVFPVPPTSTFDFSGINNVASNDAESSCQGRCQPVDALNSSLTIPGPSLFPQTAETPSSTTLPIIQPNPTTQSLPMPSPRGIYSYFQPGAPDRNTAATNQQTQVSDFPLPELQIPASGPTLPLVDSRMSTDIDFDWDKWDEMFGHFAGFEDMLLDVGKEEEQAAADGQ